MGAAEEADDFVVPVDDAEWDSLILASIPQANSVAQRLALEEQRLQEIRDEADSRRRVIDRWEADASAGAEYLIGRLKGKLSEWMRTLLDVDPSVQKTQHLLGVQVKANQRGGTRAANIRDREEFLAWSIEHDTLNRDTKVELPYDSLQHVAAGLRALAGIMTGDGAQESARAAHMLQLAEMVENACDAQVKLPIPSGWKPLDRKALERGEESVLVDPQSGEKMPGVVVPPISYDIVVSMKPEV